VSPSVSTTMIAVSLGIFVLLYVVMAVVDLLLMLRYARRELPGARGDGPGDDASDPGGQDAPVPALQY
jgi:cytochrome d ubiquinol oxidase subunit I